MKETTVQSIARGLERVCMYVATCTLGIVCDGEHQFEAATTTAAARQMIRKGWLDDFILSDSLNLACPACVKYIKDDKYGDVEKDEIDQRAGGTAKR